ncbi:hypothetical protein CHX27_08080 [Flavobacterium aurantiibacter]|uniref:Uncharacterized protein n=1 Tax=Flavobacterium aurantiibacter TaxID=2023067 RepID=A0A255ZTM8_9FLAO|nr:hypothetical protein CHX27_08080 [Flavobacterium aurantiibacter]
MAEKFTCFTIYILGVPVAKRTSLRKKAFLPPSGHPLYLLPTYLRQKDIATVLNAKKSLPKKPSQNRTFFLT